MIEVLLLNIHELDEERMAALVSAARAEKAARFVHRRDRLRSYGAGWLMEQGFPHEGELFFTDLGKPRYRGGPAFNLSHGGDYVILGYVMEKGDAPSPGEIGVDVEDGSRSVRGLEHLRTVVTPEEWDWVSNAKDTEHQTFCQTPDSRFLWLWTRREAVFKCRGAKGDIRRLPSMTGDAVSLGDLVFGIRTVTYDNHYISVAYTGGKEEIHGSIIRFAAGQRIPVF